MLKMNILHIFNIGLWKNSFDVENYFPPLFFMI